MIPMREPRLIDWAALGHDQLATIYLKMAADAADERQIALYRIFAQLHQMKHAETKP
jgi:hypothetical protein